MSAFDALQQAMFADYAFPVSDMTVTCSLRDHVHIYPHAPGGQPEKLGRNLYEFRMSAPMHDTFPKYPQLWPETLARLRFIFESGNTYDLVVPTIGTIKAYCTGWSEKMTSKKRSGVDAEFTFREDSNELYLLNEIIESRTAATFAARTNFRAQVTNAEIKEDTFDKITAAVATLEKFKGRFEQDASVVAYKAQSVVSLCQRAAALPVLDNPEHFGVLNALRDVHYSALRLLLDAGKGGKKIIPFVVPGTMSVSLVSKRLYGDTTRSLEIMRLNAIPDALSIPGGTSLRVYAPDPLALAA